MEEQIIDGIKFLLAFGISWFAVYKGWVEFAKEKTKQIETQARESSVGKEAIVAIKKEVDQLKQDLDHEVVKNKALDKAIQNLEFICEFLEERMKEIFKR